METFTSIGRLNYHSKWVLLDADDGISNYYRKLVWYWTLKKTNRPYGGSHVTVINGDFEDCSRSPLWRKYHNELIEFAYDPLMEFDGTYFWMTVECPRLSQ